MGVSEDRGTLYFVFAQDAEANAWKEVNQTYASGATEAIRKSAAANGLLVAVPARSWKPMRVEQVQTVQTVITPTAADDDTKASDSKNAPESEIRAVEAEAEES